MSKDGCRYCYCTCGGSLIPERNIRDGKYSIGCSKCPKKSVGLNVELAMDAFEKSYGIHHIEGHGSRDPLARKLVETINTSAHIVVEAVNNPSHYGGKDNVYEVIKIIRALGMNFNLGNSFKYIARAGKKDPTKHIEDLKKAVFFIEDEIKFLEGVK